MVADGNGARWAGGGFAPIALTAGSAAVSWGAWASCRRLLPLALRRLEQAGLVRQAASGRTLPTAAGIVPAVAGLAGAAALGSPAHAAAAAAAGLAGWVDDVAGRPYPKGLRGHVQVSLQEGRPTTGLLKAGIVSAAAVATGLTDLRREGPARTLLGAASVTLTANALNQLDTRPGRAAAAFLVGLGWLALRAEGRRRGRLLSWLPLAAATAAYLPYDTAGRCMLGDTGANALGAALGAAAAQALPMGRLVRWLAVGAFLNAALDAVSLNRVLDSLKQRAAMRPAPPESREDLSVRRRDGASVRRT